MLLAAVLFFSPGLFAQGARLEGGWVIVDPGTGQVLGTLEIKRERPNEVTFTGHLRSSAPGGLPPAWLGSGTLNDRGGQYSWMSLDGREGRTTIRMQGERLRLEIRCQRGTCTGSEFTYAAQRPDMPRVGPPPAAPPPVVSAPPPAAVPAPMPAPAPPAPARRAWETIRSTEGGFRIDLPGAGSYTVFDSTDRATGAALKGHRWMLELDNGWTAYVAGYSDLPAARVSSLGLDGTLSDAVKGGLQEVNGTLVSETPIIVSGYPAHEFVIAADRGGKTFTIRGRAILVGLRLYQVITLHVPGTSRLEPGEVDRVLNSFQVIR